jgi:putative flippase GtrA
LTQGHGAIAARDDLARQISAFTIIGALGFCVDAGLTVLIASGLGVSPFLARPPAVAAATIATFLLNRGFTFGGRGHWRTEFGRYIVVAASGQALNYAVYAAALMTAAALGFERSPALIALSVACGAGSAMFLTFAGFRFFAFRG